MTKPLAVSLAEQCYVGRLIDFIAILMRPENYFFCCPSNRMSFRFLRVSPNLDIFPSIASLCRFLLSTFNSSFSLSDRPICLDSFFVFVMYEWYVTAPVHTPSCTL